jgi:hypothetical protein
LVHSRDVHGTCKLTSTSKKSSTMEKKTMYINN